MNVRTQLVTGSGPTVTPGTRLLQRSLIVAQTATAVTLLVTCALIVGSFVRLAYQETGWNPQDLYRVAVAMPEGTARERTAEVRRELYDRLRRQSGVRVALADGIPVLTLVGGAVRPGDDPAKAKVSAIAYRATAEIFDVLGVQFVHGRPFDDREARMGLPVAVVDGRAAERLWPGDDPLGRQIMHSNGTIATVVGVVTPLRARLTSDDSDGVVFMTLGPTPPPRLELLGTARLHPRTADIESMVRDVAPGASARVAPVQLFERELGEPRFLAVLLLSLGLLTSLLAAVGVFGVVSHQAARRTREMGVRIALGARSPQILWLVLRDALLPAAAGLAIGVGASLWWTETLRAVIYGLEPQDPVAFAVAGALVLALVAAVSMVPARSAARTDPIRALRAE